MVAPSSAKIEGGMISGGTHDCSRFFSQTLLSAKFRTYTFHPSDVDRTASGTHWLVGRLLRSARAPKGQVQALRAQEFVAALLDRQHSMVTQARSAAPHHHI